ncbi:LOW QUALITY PROTEIN: reverse transcriptase [Phytophthora megakarya]|uniref:Reverse transcriptase n=1 Tax=Phytophthora megakarya TaxID=4795 RepID=A0A225VCZ8_9STRA|nr:LOW QUALITY PROTEIN: reverse transcriptase [Phytophthora megakarya]
MGANNIQWTRADEIHLDHQYRGRGNDHASRPTDQGLAGWGSCAADTSVCLNRLSSLHGVAESSTPDPKKWGIKIPPVPAYETPRAVLQRPKATLIQCRKVEASQDQDFPDCPPSDESPSDKSPSDKSPSEMRPLDLASVASEESDLSSVADEDSISHAITAKEALEDRNQVTPDLWTTNPLAGKATDREGRREEDDRDEIEEVSLDQLHARGRDQGTSPSKGGGSDLLPSMMSVQPETGHVTGDPLNDKCAASTSQKRTRIHHLLSKINQAHRIWTLPGTQIKIMMNACITIKEVIYTPKTSMMAVLPDVPVTTEDVRIEDIQLCGSDNQTPEEIERLRQKIWEFRHLLIGKGNALPPAARGLVCDIDVGGARSIALKCRKLRIQFREKLVDLIKGLLSAKMINYSRSPWASPIVVIIKKNGVDIRLCIDYRLVNSLTQLMIYPMPLITALLEDLESTLWYCSLDMASGFWVVILTDRARLISSFYHAVRGI